MSSHLYTVLLSELGQELNMDLHPDSNDNCLIRLKSDLEIQIKLDKREEFLVINAWVGELTEGTYKNNIFREALKSNGRSWPLYGIFGFSPKTKQLMIFEKLSVKDLRGPKIAATLIPFAEKAQLWFESIKRRDVPSSSNSSSSGNIFGLRR